MARVMFVCCFISCSFICCLCLRVIRYKLLFVHNRWWQRVAPLAPRRLRMEASLVAALSRAQQPLKSERNIKKTMSHAPRDLRCSWPDCSYVEDPFDSLEALIKVTNF